MKHRQRYHFKQAILGAIILICFTLVARLCGCSVFKDYKPVTYYPHHAGLKILWPQQPCGFDSRPEHLGTRAKYPFLLHLREYPQNTINHRKKVYLLHARCTRFNFQHSQHSIK